MAKHLNLSSFVKYIVNNVITLYDSDCAIYIPPEEAKRLKRFSHLIYTSIWLYMLRVIVFFYPINFNLGQIWYWGYQRKDNMLKKNFSDRCGMDFWPLLPLIIFYFSSSSKFVHWNFNILVPKLVNLIENLQTYGHISNVTMCYRLCHVLCHRV